MDWGRRTYVEVFGGSLSMFFNIPAKTAILNDFDNRLANFWWVVRGYKDEEKFPLYEMFRNELSTVVFSNEYYNRLQLAFERETDPIYKQVLDAVLFYMFNRMSFGGNLTLGYKFPGGDILHHDLDTWHNYFTGKQVSIWNLHFRDAIKRAIEYKGKNLKPFIYLDPPYYQEGNAIYEVGMTKEEHEELATLLGSLKHEWVLSYDDDPFIRQLYKDFRIDEVKWNYSSNDGNKTQGKHELVITNIKDEFMEA